MIELEEIGIRDSDNISHISNLSPSYAFDFDSISKTVKTIISSGHRRIPVVSKNNELTGIISYMDILDGLLRGLSRNTQINAFMTRDVISAEATENINSVLRKLVTSKRGGMPITKNQKLMGIVSERDFIRLVSNKYFNIPVKNAMSHKPITIAPNTSIQNCMKAMVNTHYRRLPVTKNKELVGIVTGIDVLRFIDENNYNSIKLGDNVTDIMSTPVKYVTETDDVSDAVKIILENNIGGLPVVNEENYLKGIITERNIIELL